VILGIDASNIRAGGGVTHLVELLGSALPSESGFSKVIVWSKASTLCRLPDRSWLEKAHYPVFEKCLFKRIFWQRFQLSKIAKNFHCDLLFVPGGSYAGDFSPFVTMSQNLLPFEAQELSRYRLSLVTMKLLLLRYTQSTTFKKSHGLIFLTKYAQDAVENVVNSEFKKIAIVPHGINRRFLGTIRPQKAISEYSSGHPFQILYVSIVTAYKHQWHVAEAVAKLHEAGHPVKLVLVGPSVPPALKRLQKTIDNVDPHEKYIRYIGPIPYEKLHEQYTQADLCLFASSCENMPNILIEGMASGLPIACSNKGPMPEVLGNAGEYFDPEKPQEIADALLKMIESPELRQKLAECSFKRVQEYSWERCADKTFRFLRDVALEYKNSK
jgi:glycosyltransferase involved in cell wall biosynthesis